jgi:hypothetical protein
MTTIVQDIQVIRSLRKDLRDIKLPSNILNSIETIHNCIKSGTDLNGWKKVEWRNGIGGTNTPTDTRPSYHKSNGTGNNGSGNSRSNGGFFVNRKGSNDRGEDYANSHYAFGGRTKTGFVNRPPTEPSISIPLTGSTSPTATATATSTESSSTPTCSFVSNDGFKTLPNKYVSKFKKSSEKVEDTILNTIILGKLNKFSEQNYSEIKEFITHIIDNGQTDMIKCFMKLVFEKAASEEMFCPLYAKLLSELSARYPVLLSEMANLYSVYMEIFEEVSQTSAENYNEVCKRNVEKKYRRGYSQFLAELIKHNVIDTELFMKTLNKIINQIELNIKNKDSTKINEEYADCVMKIMKAIQTEYVENDNDYSSDDESKKEPVVITIRQILKAESFKRIHPLTLRNPDNTGLSNKARFTFLDIYEGIQNF